MRIPLKLRAFMIWQKVVCAIVDLVPRHVECRYCHKHIRGVFARHRLWRHKLDEHSLDLLINEVMMPIVVGLSLMKVATDMSKTVEASQ